MASRFAKLLGKLIPALAVSDTDATSAVVHRRATGGRFATRRSRTKRYRYSPPVKHKQNFPSKLFRRCYRATEMRGRKWSLQVEVLLNAKRSGSPKKLIQAQKRFGHYLELREARRQKARSKVAT